MRTPFRGPPGDVRSARVAGSLRLRPPGLDAGATADRDRAIRGSPADRAVPPGHNGPGAAAQLVFGVPAEQVVLRVADLVQHAGAGVGRVQLGEHRFGGFGLPVDLPVGLATRWTQAAVTSVALSRTERAGADLVARRTWPTASTASAGVGDLGPVGRALRVAGHRELHGGPDVAGVDLRVRLQHGDAPARGAAHDRPVQRGRAAVADGARVDDEARPGRPDVRGNRPGQHRGDDQVGVIAADPVPHHVVSQGQFDRYLVPAVGEFGMHALRHAVVGTGNKQDPHRRPPRDGLAMAEGVRAALIHGAWGGLDGDVDNNLEACLQTSCSGSAARTG